MELLENEFLFFLGLERLGTCWCEFVCFFLGFGVFWNYGKVIMVFLEVTKTK